MKLATVFGAWSSNSSSTTRPRSVSKASTSRALESLLVDLGPQIRRGLDQEVAEPPRPCATGLAALDARLGGGFPCGRLSEICGPASSGRTALALTLAGATLERGHLAGWVDLADAFDPPSASASGVDLERLLWIRPASTRQALASCDRLLQTEGFELVVFDCATALPPDGGPRTARQDSIRDVTWLRLARLAARTRTALVVLSQTGTEGGTTGSRAELVLEMQPLGARFVGPPSLLDALETTAFLRRHRTRPSGSPVPLHVRADAFSEAPPGAIDAIVDPRR